MLREDLNIFTRGEFGVVALINGIEVYGLFDESYEPSFDMGGTGTESKKITFLIKSEDRRGISHGSPFELAIAQRLFEVVGVQPIGDGKLINLILKEL